MRGWGSTRTWRPMGRGMGGTCGTLRVAWEGDDSGTSSLLWEGNDPGTLCCKRGNDAGLLIDSKGNGTDAPSMMLGERRELMLVFSVCCGSEIESWGGDRHSQYTGTFTKKKIKKERNSTGREPQVRSAKRNIFVRGVTEA